MGDKMLLTSRFEGVRSFVGRKSKVGGSLWRYTSEREGESTRLACSNLPSCALTRVCGIRNPDTDVFIRILHCHHTCHRKGLFGKESLDQTTLLMRSDWPKVTILSVSAASAACCVWVLYRSSGRSRSNRNRNKSRGNSHITGSSDDTTSSSGTSTSTSARATAAAAAAATMASPRSMRPSSSKVIHTLLLLPVDVLRVLTELTRPLLRRLIRLSAATSTPNAVNAHFEFRQILVGAKEKETEEEAGGDGEGEGEGGVAVEVVEYHPGCPGTVACSSNSSSSSSSSNNSLQVEYVVVYLHGGGFSLDDHSDLQLAEALLPLLSRECAAAASAAASATSAAAAAAAAAATTIADTPAGSAGAGACPGACTCDTIVSLYSILYPMHSTAQEQSAGARAGTYSRVQAFINKQYADIVAGKDLEDQIGGSGSGSGSGGGGSRARKRVVVGLAGDSAGGNLCVSLALALQDKGQRVPPLVLLSPWLHPHEDFADNPKYLSPSYVDYINPSWGSRSRQRYYGPDRPTSAHASDSANISGKSGGSSSSGNGSGSGKRRLSPLMYYGQPVYSSDTDSDADADASNKEYVSPERSTATKSGTSKRLFAKAGAGATGTDGAGGSSSEGGRGTNSTASSDAGNSTLNSTNSNSDMCSYDPSDTRLLVNRIPALAPMAAQTLVLVGQRELLYDQIMEYCRKWDACATAAAAATATTAVTASKKPLTSAPPIAGLRNVLRCSRSDPSFDHVQVIVGAGEVHVYPLAWRPALDLLLVPFRALLGRCNVPSWLYTFKYDTLFSEMNLFLDRYTPAQHAIIDMARFIASHIRGQGRDGDE